ncbi:MAG TPA: adenylate/guanylate cyclase domain-containing protein [Geminicoccaceae bacterium]
MAGAAEHIVAWSVSGGLEGLDQADLIAGYCERLAAAGVPLWRASIGADTLHPLIAAQGHRWLAGEGVQEEFYARTDSPEADPEWRQSPWYRMIESRERQMRRRLAAGEGSNEFPLLARLAAQGGTDYWARIVPFGNRRTIGETRGVATSWTTRDPAGFAGRDLELIEATLPAFALAFKATMAIDTAGVLVSTYLGQDAAARILRGEIDRGQVKTVPTVLWFSDLVGFTRIADSLAREQVLELLNAYADCLVGVVHAHGGEVLKFMGDGILAVFHGDRGHACGRALDAAAAARAAMARLNRERSAAGLPVTGFTLALHEGEVLSGNVGSQERLDFTVIGPAVNEVSRIQAMSRSLDQPILISASFAAASGDQRARLVSVGRYALRGVGRPQELFTLDLAEADPA